MSFHKLGSDFLVIVIVDDYVDDDLMLGGFVWKFDFRFVMSNKEELEPLKGNDGRREEM